MAREFATVFTYKGNTYRALISQVDGSLSIHVPDTSLHTILPNGRASLDLSKGVQINKTGPTFAQDWMVCI